MTKEEFNKVWKDTSREGILNQFYYDYMYMQKLKKDINKAIKYIESKEYQYGDLEQDAYDYDIGVFEIEELLEILKGEK